MADLVQILQNILKKPVQGAGNDLPSQGGITGNAQTGFNPQLTAPNNQPDVSPGFAPKLEPPPSSTGGQVPFTIPLDNTQPPPIDRNALNPTQSNDGIKFQLPPLQIGGNGIPVDDSNNAQSIFQFPTQAPAQATSTQTGFAPQLPPLDRSRIVDNQPVNDITSQVSAPNSAQNNPLNILMNRQSEIVGKDYHKTKNADGTVDYGKDYDQNNSFKHKLWSELKAIGLGFAQGGLPGAVAGGVQQGFDPNSVNKTLDQIKLSQINPRIQAQQAQQKAILENQKLGAEYKGLNIKNFTDAEKYKQLVADPYMQTLLKQQQITPEQSAYIKQAYDLDVPPASWREFQTVTRNGVSYTGTKFDPRFAENKTLPTEIGDTWTNVKIGNQNVPVQTKGIGTLTESVENNNANRALQKGLADDRNKIEIDRTNAAARARAQEQNNSAIQHAADQKFELMKSLIGVNSQFAGQRGDVEAKINTVSDLNRQLSDIESQDGWQSDDNTVKRHNKLVDDLTRANAAQTESLKKLGATSEQIQQLKQAEPPPPQKYSAQQISAPNQYSSKDEFIKAARAHGLTGDALKRAVIQGKRDGKY